MKYPLILCIIITFCLVGCSSNAGDSPIVVTIYEAADQSVLLPAFIAVDLQGDTSRIKDILANRNYLLGTRSDTISVEAKAYLNSGDANSLFKYLRPNVEHYKLADDFSFKNSAILGEGLVTDTLRVNRLLMSKFIGTDIHFIWIPGGIMPGEKNDPIDKRRLMNLVALPIPTHCLQVNDAQAQRIKPEMNLFSFLGRKQKDKYLIEFSDSSITETDAVFGEDAPLLLQCKINGHNYYAAESTGAISDNNNKLLVFAEW